MGNFEQWQKDQQCTTNLSVIFLHQPTDFTKIVLNRKDLLNTLSSVYNVTTICHQVYCMHWWRTIHGDGSPLHIYGLHEYILNIFIQIKLMNILDQCQYGQVHTKSNPDENKSNNETWEPESVKCKYPDSKVHGANMGPTWVLSAPDGPLVGPMNLAIRVFHQSSEITWNENGALINSDIVLIPWVITVITTTPNMPFDNLYRHYLNSTLCVGHAFSRSLNPV